MVYSVFERSEMDVQSAIENDLIIYDDDLKEIIDIYLSLVTDWVHDLVACADTSKALWVLKDEWQFCKNNLYFVTASEDLVFAKRFCTMYSSVNESLIHSLNDIDSKHKQPLMEYVANMEMYQDLNQFSMDSDANEENKNSIVEGQQVNIETFPDNKNEEEEEAEEVYEGTDEEDGDVFHDPKDDHRHKFGEEVSDSFDVNLKCNEFKEEINQIRKRCMKALSFCANLIGDLELAAKYVVRSSIQSLLNELKATNHVLVMFTNPELQTNYRNTPNSSSSSFDSSSKCPLSFMIFVPQEFAKDKAHIARLLFIISAKDDYETGTEAKLGSPKYSSSSKNLRKGDKHNSSLAVGMHDAGQVRRLSSSSCILDANSEIMRTNYLNKLSKMAQMGQTTTPTNPGINGSFIYSPPINLNGYLLYLQLPKSKNGKITQFNFTSKIILC